MTIRTILISVSLLLLFPVPNKAENDLSKACGKFVQDFYDWYVIKAENESQLPASSTAIKEKREIFSADIRKALEVDFKAQENSPGEIVSLDFDPFLNSQDPSNQYMVGKVVIAKSTCLVDVHNMVAGKKSATPAVVAEVKSFNGKLRFVNFYYKTSNKSFKENLLELLKRLNDRRKRSSTIK
jgi:hypothetical protein